MDYLTDIETTEAAFAPRDDERNVPIDYGQHKFRFTKKWFRQRNQATFSTHLIPKFAGRQGRKRPFRMIQIGVFEAQDLVWSCQNLLAHHPDSLALAIDPWAATRKINADAMEQVHQRAEWNLRPWRKKVQLVRGYSEEMLQDRNPIQIHGRSIQPGQWDLVVVDGDHNAPAVIEDAVNASALARPGGWILFDDVRNRTVKKNHVADGLRAFLADHGDEVELAWFHRFCNAYEKKK